MSGGDSSASRKRREVRPGAGSLLLDGGKGQLSAVAPVFGELGVGTDLPDVPLRSLAKRDEEVYEPGRPEPVILRRESPELYLLQRVRDEAHRFANTYHRKLRGQAMTASVLDELPGVARRARKDSRTLRHPGSLPRSLARRTRSCAGASG